MVMSQTLPSLLPGQLLRDTMDLAELAELADLIAPVDRRQYRLFKSHRLLLASNQEAQASHERPIYRYQAQQA